MTESTKNHNCDKCCKKSDYYVNTTSTHLSDNKKLDKKEWKMLSPSLEYVFYKEILILLIMNFIKKFEEDEIIKFTDKIRPANEWLIDNFLDSFLTFIPVISDNECYIKNIINNKKIITYNYSDMSDLTLKDCLTKMVNDLTDLYNLDDYYE